MFCERREKEKLTNICDFNKCARTSAEATSKPPPSTTTITTRAAAAREKPALSLGSLPECL